MIVREVEGRAPVDADLAGTLNNTKESPPGELLRTGGTVGVIILPTGMPPSKEPVFKGILYMAVVLGFLVGLFLFWLVLVLNPDLTEVLGIR